MLNLSAYTSIVQSPWDYTLLTLNEEYILEVVCGSVASYSVYIRLTADEIQDYIQRGEKALDSIAEMIRNNTNEQKKRKIEAN